MPEPLQEYRSILVFDPESKIFELTYNNNADINAPTEIFVPDRHYPNGWDLTIDGTDNWNMERDEVKQLVKISCDEHVELHVIISPK